MSIFRVFLPLTDLLGATFNERDALTSRKYVAEQGTVMRKSSKIFQTFWLHLSVFPLKKQHKDLNYQIVFTSNRSFGGYFQ